MLITNPFCLKVMASLALFGIAMCAVGWLLPHLTTARKFLKRYPFFLVFAYLMTVHAQKPMIHYDGGIREKTAQQSWVTNNTVAVFWERDPNATIIPPDNSPVFIDYRPIGSTNEWGMLAQTVLNAWSWTGELEGATNYDFNVYAYYIPPEPVHTNGVWQYTTITDPEHKRGIIPLRATIKDEVHTIYPPQENEQ